MRQKQVFKTIFLLFAALLIILPFLVSFNEALTKLIERIKIYTWVQNALVPYEVAMVRTLTSPFSISFVPYANGMVVNGTFLEMTWNCIGWQSLLLLFITFLVGFGITKYSLISELETIAIGLLGTFLMNLLRLALIVLIWAYARPIYFYVYHDYLAAIFTVIWLFFFWWFSYKFVLVENEGSHHHSHL